MLRNSSSRLLGPLLLKNHGLEGGLFQKIINGYIFYFLGQLFSWQLFELFARVTNLKKQSSVRDVAPSRGWFWINFHPRKQKNWILHHASWTPTKQFDSSTKLSVKRSILENWRYLKTLRVIWLFSSRLVWLGFSGPKQVLGKIRWRVVKLSTNVQSYFNSTIFIMKSPTFTLFETYIFLKIIQFLILFDCMYCLAVL